MDKFEQIYLTKDMLENQLECYLANTIKILTKAGYECVVTNIGDENTGDIYEIKYNFVEEMGMGNPSVYWLDEDDLDALQLGYDVIEEMCEEDF